MLLVEKVHPAATRPTVANPGEDLGYDLYAIEDTTLVLGRPTKVRTGIKAYFEPVYDWHKYGLLIRDRSSMAAKGIVTSGGVIDAGYRGEIMIIMTLLNDTEKRYDIKAGDKIAQMIPIPVNTAEVQEVAVLPPSSRGSDGFGSTGR